jgi:Helix-turn-helix
MIRIATKIGNRTFRATGITIYLSNGAALEHAQEMAAHESPRTTKLYDRTKERLHPYCPPSIRSRLDQASVAEKAGLDRSRVSRIENGEVVGPTEITAFWTHSQR